MGAGEVSGGVCIGVYIGVEEKSGVEKMEEVGMSIFGVDLSSGKKSLERPIFAMSWLLVPLLSEPEQQIRMHEHDVAFVSQL